MKAYTLLALAALSLPAAAEEYQWISDVDYISFDTGLSDEDAWRINSRYFFDKKQTLGPLNEFAYINTVSNFGGSYVDYDYGSSHAFGGQYFTDNVMFGAEYVEDIGLASASFGYLFSDDLMVRLTAFDDEASIYDFNLSVSYNHQMGDDYIGFNFNTDEEFESPNVSTKYFNNMGNGQYLTASFSITDLDDERDAAAGIGYYFNERQSIDVFVAEGGFYTLEYQHFFNKNVALDVAYSDEDDLDGEIIRVGVTVQL